MGKYGQGGENEGNSAHMQVFRRILSLAEQIYGTQC
jgi:hypothetical protein